MKKMLALSLSLLAVGGVVAKDTVHPCVQFERGSNSTVGKMLCDYFSMFAAAEVKASNGVSLDAMACITFPFFNSIVHEHGDAMAAQGGWKKWLVSNWTTLGLGGIVYLLKDRFGLSNQEALRAIFAAAYAQGLLAIGVAELSDNSVTA